MRGRSIIVGCLALLLACSGEETGEPSESGSGSAPNVAPNGGTSATGGTPALPPNGGSSGSAGGDQHPALAGGQGGGLTPQPCSLVAPTECPSPDLNYAAVEPIFRERCVVCHVGMPGGPWPLNSYGHVATWRDSIRAVLLQCAMPPADSGLVIAPADSLRILEWIRCGMPP